MLAKYSVGVSSVLTATVPIILLFLYARTPTVNLFFERYYRFAGINNSDKSGHFKSQNPSVTKLFFFACILESKLVNSMKTAKEKLICFIMGILLACYYR